MMQAQQTDHVDLERKGTKEGGLVRRSSGRAAGRRAGHLLSCAAPGARRSRLKRAGQSACAVRPSQHTPVQGSRTADDSTTS